MTESFFDKIKDEFEKYQNDMWFWSTLFLAGVVILMALWFLFKAK